jgi:hypothetical protein
MPTYSAHYAKPEEFGKAQRRSNARQAGLSSTQLGRNDPGSDFREYNRDQNPQRYGNSSKHGQ